MAINNPAERDNEPQAEESLKEKQAREKKELKEQQAREKQEQKEQLAREKQEQKAQKAQEKLALKAQKAQEQLDDLAQKSAASRSDDDDAEGTPSTASKNPIAAITGLLSGNLKIVLIAVAGLLVIGGGAFYWFFMRDTGSATAAEGGSSSTSSASDTSDAGDGAAVRPSDYAAAFFIGDTKVIFDANDPSGEPLYEITIHSAKELNTTEKAEFGLSRESGRLAAVEVDVHLVDESSHWDLYNRRFADAAGNWLDEILWTGDGTQLHVGSGEGQTMFVRLPAERPANETISLSIFSASWNAKGAPDGWCEIAVSPATSSARPSTGQANRVVDTEFGHWDGRSYTSTSLDMRIDLPEDWSNRHSAAQEGDAGKVTEVSAIRADGRALLQITVDKQPGESTEADRIHQLSEVLSRTAADYVVDSPHAQTIAAKDYYGFTYSSEDSFYQVYLLKTDGRLIEIALLFPIGERDSAGRFVNVIQTMR